MTLIRRCLYTSDCIVIETSYMIHSAAVSLIKTDRKLCDAQQRSETRSSSLRQNDLLSPDSDFRHIGVVKQLARLYAYDLYWC